MYFLFAIPALALIVVLSAWFYDLTKGFRRSPKTGTVSKGTLTVSATGASLLLKSDRTR